MKVQVEDNLYITSDERQFILSKQVFSKNGKTGEINEVMQPLGYYSTLEGVLKAILRRKIHESTAASISELIADMQRVKAYIASQIEL